MTDPTHPASTDTPAEGGAVALNGEETERLCYFVAALEMFGKHGGNLISREAAAEVSDLLDRALKRIAALSRPAPIEPGVREKVETALLALKGIPAPIVNDGVVVSYRASDDVPEDIFVAISHLEALLSSNTGEG